MLNAEQFEYFKEKYQKLIYKISHKISGDNAIASVEDNIQDLWIALFDAIDGFEKQGEGQNGKLEDFIGTVAFDKYLKTCLWTRKHNKGKHITKKRGLTSGTVDVFEHGDALNVTDRTITPDFEIFIEEFADKLSFEEMQIIQEVIGDPDLIHPSGRVNVSQLARSLKKPGYKIRQILKEMSEKFKNEF